MVIGYSDQHLVNEQVFRPPFKCQSAIHTPGTMVPGIRIANHLNNKQAKVCYFDVSAVQIPTKYKTTLHQNFVNFAENFCDI